MNVLTDSERLRALEAAFGLPDAGPPATEAALDARTIHLALLAEMLGALRAAPGLPRPLTPDRPLRDLAGGTVTPDWLDRIGTAADLDLSLPFQPAPLGNLLRAALAFGLVATALGLTLATGEWGGLLIALALPSVTLAPVPRRLPPAVATLGDLLREALPRNHPRLRVPLLHEDPTGRSRLLATLDDQITARPRPARPPSTPETPQWQT